MKPTVSLYIIYLLQVLISFLDLISTLLSLSAVRLPLQTLTTSLDQVSIYLSKFQTRLTPAHALHLKRLVTFLDALRTYAQEWNELRKKKGTERMQIFMVPDLVQRLGRRVEGVNFLEIELYLRTSKVLGFCVHVCLC
jgi:chromosome transmission fidelity protein 1